MSKQNHNYETWNLIMYSKAIIPLYNILYLYTIAFMSFWVKYVPIHIHVSKPKRSRRPFKLSFSDTNNSFSLLYCSEVRGLLLTPADFSALYSTLSLHSITHVNWGARYIPPDFVFYKYPQWAKNICLILGSYCC